MIAGVSVVFTAQLLVTLNHPSARGGCVILLAPMTAQCLGNISYFKAYFKAFDRLLMNILLYLNIFFQF